MKEMPDLICGKAAVGGNYNSTRDNNVQKYSVDDYCYALSGNGALFMHKDIIKPDVRDFIAFNEKSDYVEQIPDDKAIERTKFYMPGVAYNLIFYFEEEQ